MKSDNKMNDFSDLRSILPEAIQEEMRKLDREEQKNNHDGKGKQLQVKIDKTGRKGKVVTVISGFQHNPQTMEKIAKTLKSFCGAGGTVKGLVIEIQGDNRVRIIEKLTSLNYLVK